MFHRNSRLRLFALWLALAGVLLRGMIPAGFMPGWTQAGSDGGRSWLMICPAGELQALLPPDPHAHHHHHAGMVMSGASMAAMPGMGSGEHVSHRIGEANLACPFAAAAGPALPACLASLTLEPIPVQHAAIAQSALVFPASSRRLPPARAPPTLS